MSESTAKWGYFTYKEWLLSLHKVAKKPTVLQYFGSLKFVQAIDSHTYPFDK